MYRTAKGLWFSLSNRESANKFWVNEKAYTNLALGEFPVHKFLHNWVNLKK